LLPSGASLSALIPSHTRPFSLAARWTPSVSAGHSFVSSLLLAHGTHPSAPSASLTSRPHTPLWTRPRRAFPGHLRTHPTSFLSLHPTHCPHPVAPPAELPRSLSLYAHLGSSTAALRGPPLVLRPSWSLCRVHCLGEFCLFISSSGQPSVRPQPLWFARSAHTGVLLVQPEPRHHRSEVSLRPAIAQAPLSLHSR
jgi:hypothetical protein